MSACLAASAAAAAPPRGKKPGNAIGAEASPRSAADTPSASAKLVESKRESNRGGDAAGIAGLLSAVLKGLPPPLANQVQAAVAEVFKSGDLALNLPTDAADKLGRGDLAGALDSIGSGAAGTLESLPGDVSKITGIGGKKE
ncbi:hypothetical protein C2857_002959 [Epichloe festucae Fl1]|uniref:Uncharacterized protein n=1 Tax=Epichloe festucae (strain Fl1) TaxID=877507 RepID=A0A7S9KNP5_EPIFF|nr:hypothetical protein C2857_002959 [Epichloe festucae Fl1]